MLAQARESQSAVLVIRGEPGIGKTSLLRYAARQASGLRTAEVEGVQAEMELPFAGIHRLCAPMPTGSRAGGAAAERAPGCLRRLVGCHAGQVPGRRRRAQPGSVTAERRPLLCLVDDAQWLDAASAQALGFVARRLLAEPVAMMFSLREPVTTRALTACRSCRSTASMTRMRAPCCRAPYRAGSTTASATGSSPRPGQPAGAAWSCRRG